VNRPHVVVVGGGFGGLNAARALAGQPVRVTLLDRRNHHLFQPLLYQVATAALNASDIAAPLRSVLRRAGNVTVLLAEVERVDLGARRLGLDRGELGYDALILAAGASHSYFGHEDWEAFAPGLKTLEDALEIRRRVLLAYESAERETDGAEQRALLTFVVANEEDSATTKVEVTFPQDHPIAEALTTPMAGWTAKVTSKAVTTPIKTDEGEINEAVNTVTWTATAGGFGAGEFGSFAVSVGLPDDAEYVNPHGGAIALGHPLGASGARLTATLVCELERSGSRVGGRGRLHDRMASRIRIGLWWDGCGRALRCPRRRANSG
jgi:hypothetical protein